MIKLDQELDCHQLRSKPLSHKTSGAPVGIEAGAGKATGFHAETRRTRSDIGSSCRFTNSAPYITVYLRADQRKRTNAQYLTYGVSYCTTDGCRATRSFQVGNIEIIGQQEKEHAARTAEAFRTEYAWCRREGKPFNPERYKDWRHSVLYPFCPPETTNFHQRKFYD